MKKLVFAIFIIASFLLLLFVAFKSVKIETNNEEIKNGTLQIEMKRSRIKEIKEISTASQIVTVRIDTNYNSTSNIDLKILYWKINLGKELKENRLIYLQKYEGKAGFKNVDIYRSDSVFTVEYNPCQLLSLELITDSVILEKGTWTKRGTSKLETQNKAKALANISHDSLFNAANYNFKKYITGIIINISNKYNIIQFKEKN